MKFLNYNLSVLKEKNAALTAKEITQQPQLWLTTYQLLKSQSAALQKFLNTIYNQNDVNIILTGAGSSAFIGEILEGPFQRHTGKITRAIATTDLISHPQNYFIKNKNTLLVSFARSGDSPESIAAYHLANEFCNSIFHLIITCNDKGALAGQSQHVATFVLLLPKEANDQGLAMTGSFTAMLLAGLLIAQLSAIEQRFADVARLSKYGEKIIEEYAAKLKDIARLDFERVVFLGSGPQKGLAEESHLKVQELTDGKIICKYDSFLGFRHGPKVVINEKTIVCYLFSNNSFVRQYETDLVKSIQQNQKALYQVGVMEYDTHDMHLDDVISFSDQEDTVLAEEFLTVCSILPAQILGFYKSLQLGLTPDNPSENGAITRVVQGVKIYTPHYNSKKETVH